MSNSPYLLERARSGYRMGNAVLVDSMIKDGLWDPYKDIHMGNCAEMCVSKYKFTREEQDAFALRSHQRAIAAIDGGRFTDELVPVNGLKVDEGPRRDTSMEALAKLKPAFHAKGTVTAGNSSQTSDGAAAVIVTSAERARAAGLAPMARFVTFATAGVEPERFGIGPVPAIRRAASSCGSKITIAVAAGRCSSRRSSKISAGLDLLRMSRSFARGIVVPCTKRRSINCVRAASSMHVPARARQSRQTSSL